MGVVFHLPIFFQNSLSCSWLFVYVNYGHGGSFKLWLTTKLNCSLLLFVFSTHQVCVFLFSHLVFSSLKFLVLILLLVFLWNSWSWSSCSFCLFFCEVLIPIIVQLFKLLIPLQFDFSNFWFCYSNSIFQVLGLVAIVWLFKLLVLLQFNFSNFWSCCSYLIFQALGFIAIVWLFKLLVLLQLLAFFL